MDKLLFIFFLFFSCSAMSQQNNVFTLNEYLAHVKKYHPIVKQANLIIDESEAKLLKARGGFDPKLEANYDSKEFKDTHYWNNFNTSFKIPTWYGIEIKGAYENYNGEYINPENSVPDEGLYSVGVSIPIARGLLMNERIATLKQAKLYQKQAEVDNQLLVTEVLYEALVRYFQWLKAHQEKQVYESFLENSIVRFQGIRRSYETGETPAIDTTEARLAVNNRKLDLEKASLNYIKAGLELSNYLWMDNTPIELKESVLPDTLTPAYVDEVLELGLLAQNADLNSHPKLMLIDYKYKNMEIERRLMKNRLLPKIDFQYNFLTTTPDYFSYLKASNYKAGITVGIPLFLRKERAELKLADLKLKAIEFESQFSKVVIRNKITSVQQEILSYQNQFFTALEIVADYSTLLRGEEQKFNIGESSVFLVNSRESKLIENKLKLIGLENSILNAKGKLFNYWGIGL